MYLSTSFEGLYIFVPQISNFLRITDRQIILITKIMNIHCSLKDAIRKASNSGL